AAGALKPGGYAQIHFDLPEHSGAVTVPSSAILFRAGGAQLATVDGKGHVQLHAVRIGQDDGPTVQILSGATAGMQVVDNPPDSLSPGELVRVGAASHG
ncbi:efflux RND transporter periplasmic adaptor subunit, partial [Sphingomonas sanguinis]